MTKDRHEKTNTIEAARPQYLIQVVVHYALVRNTRYHKIVVVVVVVSRRYVPALEVTTLLVMQPAQCLDFGVHCTKNCKRKKRGMRVVDE
jgi:hypothetical protein